MIRFLARRHVPPPAVDDMASALAHGQVTLDQQRTLIARLTVQLADSDQRRAALAREVLEAQATNRELEELVPWPPR